MDLLWLTRLPPGAFAGRAVCPEVEPSSTGDGVEAEVEEAGKAGEEPAFDMPTDLSLGCGGVAEGEGDGEKEGEGEGEGIDAEGRVDLEGRGEDLGIGEYEGW